MVFLWKLSDVSAPAGNLFEDDEDDSMNKETWVIHKTLRSVFKFYWYAARSIIAVLSSIFFVSVSAQLLT
jgi:hypothetical protein